MIPKNVLTRETIPPIRLDLSCYEGLPASPRNVSAIKQQGPTLAPRLRSHIGSNIFASVLAVIDAQP